VIELINRDYPRGGIGQPGLTAGTCLRKDFAFSEERSSAPGMLLAVSRVHETVPLFLVEGMKRRLGSLRDRKVAVLGLTFKRDIDDVRDSLSAKLIRLLERELARVARHDPYVHDESEPLASALAEADAVVIATNHSAYDGLAPMIPAGALVVDPWNASGTGEVFAVASGEPAAGARATARRAGAER
jgi:UDP-N-acetyl-D-mannosaminuronic acid dehydrogenase